MIYCSTNRTPNAKNRLCFAFPAAALLLLTATITPTEAWSPNSPYGCDDTFFAEQDNGGDCYSVNRRLCQYQMRGCLKLTATYDYYNSVSETGLPRDDYVTVDVTTSTGCEEDSCSVSVNGETCGGESCTLVGNRGVILESCSDLPGVFPDEDDGNPQQLFLTRFGGNYLKLAYDSERCQHPAINGCPTTGGDNTTDSITTTTIAPTNLRGNANNITLVLGTRFELSFYPVADPQYDNGPDEDAIETIITKTVDFFVTVFEEYYPNNFQGFRMAEITSEYSQEMNTFDMIFTSYISFQNNTGITVGQAALVLKNEDALNDYMVDVRYTGDDNLNPNGMFLYTSFVAANIDSCSVQ